AAAQAAAQALAQREAQRVEAAVQAAARTAAQAPARQEEARKTDTAGVGRTIEKQAQTATESSKRRTFIGRTEQDLRLRMMAEGWRQKIEQSAPMDVLQAAKNGPYENPIVTVALRRDGSLESVVIERSSGVPAIDNAIRRVILMLSPFAPFSSELAAEYDVVEIRRIWTFDTAVRLLYGGR
ncbi:MAG: TonB C-terminal domain-containing protein, partial [Comamonadaceae bacterium]